MLVYREGEQRIQREAITDLLKQNGENEARLILAETRALGSVFKKKRFMVRKNKHAGFDITVSLA